MSIIRIRISGRSAFKVAEVVSNTIVLATNTYLTGTSINNQIRNRKRERIAENLQMAAEIAGTVASLGQVISETLEQHRASPG